MALSLCLAKPSVGLVEVLCFLPLWYFFSNTGLCIRIWASVFHLPPAWLRFMVQTAHIHWTKKILQWRQNEHDGISHHQPYDCLLHRLFRRRSKKTSKLCVTGLCAGNSTVTGEFPSQRASNAKNVSIWWHHHEKMKMTFFTKLTSMFMVWHCFISDLF